METLSRKTVMNKITSPQLLLRVCNKNKRLLNDFLRYLHSIGRSKTTIEAYKHDIQIAWVWCL